MFSEIVLGCENERASSRNLRRRWSRAGDVFTIDLREQGSGRHSGRTDETKGRTPNQLCPASCLRRTLIRPAHCFCVLFTSNVALNVSTSLVVHCRIANENLRKPRTVNHDGEKPRKMQNFSSMVYVGNRHIEGKPLAPQPHSTPFNASSRLPFFLETHA